MKLKKIFAGVLALVMVMAVSGCGSDVTQRVARASGSDVFTVADLHGTVTEAKILLTSKQIQYQDSMNVEEDMWDVEINDTTLLTETKNEVVAELSCIKLINLLAEMNEITLDSDEEEEAKAAGKEYYSALSKEQKKYTKASKKKATNLYRQYALAMKTYEVMSNELQKDFEGEYRNLAKDITTIYNEESVDEIENADISTLTVDFYEIYKEHFDKQKKGLDDFVKNN